MEIQRGEYLVFHLLAFGLSNEREEFTVTLMNRFFRSIV